MRTCTSRSLLSLPSKADSRSARAAPFECSETACSDSYLDHDQSVGPLVQRVQLNAGLVMNPGDRRFAGCDHLGAVLGKRKGRGDQDNAHFRWFLS